MKRLLFAIILLLLLFAPVLAQDATPEATPESTETSMSNLFDYDQSTPLNVTVQKTEMQGSVTVKTISYPSPVTQKAINATLVVPAGNGPFPAIIYVHWYEPSSPTSNRSEFLKEAVSMAQQYGVESILPDTMWADPNWYQQGRTLDSDYGDAIRQVIELRRGLDVLLSQPNIDTAKVAYVGHDFGAMYGSLLAGVDQRAKAYVFIAGASDFNQWMLFGVPDNQAGLKEYEAKMETIAPTHFVAQVAPASILFQFGSQDGYTPEDDFLAFYNAASDPKELRVYESDHPMASDEIRTDRVNFLATTLGLKMT